MTRLHIFLTDDGDNYIIAANEFDAYVVLHDQVGEDEFAPGRMYADVQFVQWPDHEVFTLWDVDEPGCPQESHLPFQWAALYGRCYLGGQA